MRFLRLSLLIFVYTFLFAGVRWESITTSTSKGGTSTMKIKGCAEGDFVRIDYVDISGKEILQKEGGYWIYNGKTNTILMVDTKEKEYIEIQNDSLSKIMEGLENIMNISIKNPKIQVERAGKESVSGYDCEHYIIKVSYETEVSVMIMKMLMKYDETREVWATSDNIFKDVFTGYKKNGFKTSFKAIDELLEKEMELSKDIGFPLKTIVYTKIYDPKGKLTDERRSETIVSNIKNEHIPNSMFTVPKDYKKSEFKIGGTQGIEY